MVKCVLLLLCYMYHLLLGGVVSKFTPTVYPAKILSSSQCGQYNPYHEQLREVLQQIEQNIPRNRTPGNCKFILPISSLRLLQHHYYQWLYCTGLL